MRLLGNFKLLYSKTSQAQKARNAYKQTKIKNAPKKHLRGNSHLFVFLCFCLGVFMTFGAFSAFSACKMFS